MPREAAYTLAWSALDKVYTLCERETVLMRLREEGSLLWREWLTGKASFAFRGQQGSYTARREQIKPGDWYWYAYRRSQKRVRKKYLGKSETLSLQRLEEVAALFNGEEASTLNANERKQASADEETSGTTSPRAVVVVGKQVLATKLRAPLPPRHLIARPRLTEYLSRALSCPVTLLSAPAGSGKSTLLSSWLRESSLRSAWLALDRADNEPVRFWTYVFTALDMLYPGAGKHAQHVLSTLRTPDITDVLTLLLNTLDRRGSTIQGEMCEALLVLDDYHVISNETIQRTMAFLIEHVPEHLHLLISTRHDPPLPLPRLRVHDRLLELRANELRFSHEEIAAFVASHTGLTLQTEEVTQLEERTGGWAAGLQLVALLQHGQEKRPDILQSVHGDQRPLVEYLEQEILDQLPESVQRFLLHTSILEHLEGRLCEAVSGQPGGEQTLSWLLQRNLFLIPLEGSRRWYRYHQLFADALRHRLQISDAGLIPQLQHRAARWYREQGMFSEAISYAYAAEDWESIASITEEVGVELMSRGETRLVMGWVSLLPRAVVFSRLRLFLFDCWYHWYNGQPTIVAEMLREYTRQYGLPAMEVEDAMQLEQAINTHVETFYPHPAWSVQQRANRVAEMLALYGALSMLRADGAAFSRTVCQRAVDYVAGLPHRARIAQHLGTVCMLRGELHDTATVLEDALASALADESATWTTSLGYRLGMLYEMMGQLHNVTRIAQQILQLASDKIFLTQATAYILLGNVTYEHNNLQAAEHSYQLAIDACAEANLIKEIDPYMHFLLGHLQLARIQVVRHDKAAARQNLDQIADYLERHPVGGEVLPVIKGRYALLMHDLGDESALQQWLATFPAPETGEQMLQRQLISLNTAHLLIYVQALLACQRWHEAKPIIQKQRVLVERQELSGSLLQWLILQAQLAQAQGDSEQALTALAHALAMAERRGYIRLFVDTGPSLLPLFYRLRQQLRSQNTVQASTPGASYLEQLILCINRKQQASLKEDGPLPLVEPLSMREREVLWHISQGHSNREIAEQLVIAPSTVKSHVRAIYSKLGVENRVQALRHLHKPGQASILSSE